MSTSTMVVSPWRRRQAQAEVARRRKMEATYTEPLGVDAAQSDEEFIEMKQFLKEFYGSFYSRDSYGKRHATVLHEFPQVVTHYKNLVPDQISEEEFWQRHDYRCDEERVLRQWERRPDEGQKNRASALAKKNVVQTAFDASVSAVKSSAEKLAASLQEASKDVETWNDMDAKVEAQKEEEENSKKGVSVTATNVEKSSKTTTAWSWIFGSNSSGASNKNASVNNKTNGEASPTTKNETSSTSSKKSSALSENNKNTKPLRSANRRAESLRAATSSKGRGGKNATVRTTSTSRSTNHITNEKQPSSVDEGENKNEASTATLQAVKRWYQPMLSPRITILIAIVIGFIANAICRFLLSESMIGGWCSRPSVDAPSRLKYLICGDKVNGSGAVEVFDNSARNQRGRQSNNNNNNRYGNNRRTNYNHGDPDMLDSDGYDNGDGMIGNLINSWMQNTDFSQFTNAAAAGAEQQEQSRGLISDRRRRGSDAIKENNHRGGVVGFFRKRFGKNKSTDLAPQNNNHYPLPGNVVLHQHVHHVVHHVIHEVKQS